MQSFQKTWAGTARGKHLVARAAELEADFSRQTKLAPLHSDADLRGERLPCAYPETDAALSLKCEMEGYAEQYVNARMGYSLNGKTSWEQSAAWFAFDETQPDVDAVIIAAILSANAAQAVS